MTLETRSLIDPTTLVEGTASVSPEPDSVSTIVITESAVRDAEETVYPVAVKSAPATVPEEMSSLKVARIRSICPSVSLSEVVAERKTAAAASDGVVDPDVVAFAVKSLIDPEILERGTASVSAVPDSVSTIVITESAVRDAEDTV